MPLIKRQRRSHKKRQIVEAGIELFSRFGVRRVTVEEICRTAGASKMTFYKHFDNKIALLKHIWKSWIEEGFRRLDQIDATDIPFPEKLQRIIDFKIELASKMSPEFIEEILAPGSEMADFLEEMMANALRPFIDFIGRAQRRGDMRPMRPEFFLAVVDKIYEIAQDENLRRAYPSHADFVREVNHFLFFGVLPMEKKIR